jgi:hypothetical protein
MGPSGVSRATVAPHSAPELRKQPCSLCRNRLVAGVHGCAACCVRGRARWPSATSPQVAITHGAVLGPRKGIWGYALQSGWRALQVRVWVVQGVLVGWWVKVNLVELNVLLLSLQCDAGGCLLLCGGQVACKAGSVPQHCCPLPSHQLLITDSRPATGNQT